MPFVQGQWTQRYVHAQTKSMQPIGQEIPPLIMTKRAKPLIWWKLEALKHDGDTCPKCQGLTRARYISPTPGECAIIESCYACGWDKYHLRGISNVRA